MSEKPTPETDALAAEHRGAVIWPDFARRLESERDAERTLADELGIGLMSTCCLLSIFPEWHLSQHSKKFAKSIATWKEARGE